MSRFDSALMWFRRDLRCADNAALHAALKSARRVYCAFVYDTEILDALPSRADRRVEFIWQSVAELGRELAARGGGLIALHGSARSAIPGLADTLGVHAVYANHDYEPEAAARDAAVAQALKRAGIEFLTRKDQVIFERNEILTQGGTPFSVLVATAVPCRPRFQRDQSAGTGHRRWRDRSARAVQGFSAAHGALSGNPQLSGAERAFIPVGAPALWHDLHSPAGARGVAGDA
ncbi:MAG: phr [Proteobacteria bacterium]|nr:phr [Pseudomonadota bacterium]